MNMLIKGKPHWFKDLVYKPILHKMLLYLLLQ